MDNWFNLFRRREGADTRSTGQHSTDTTADTKGCQLGGKYSAPVWSQLTADSLRVTHHANDGPNGHTIPAHEWRGRQLEGRYGNGYSGTPPTDSLRCRNKLIERYTTATPVYIERLAAQSTCGYAPVVAIR